MDLAAIDLRRFDLLPNKLVRANPLRRRGATFADRGTHAGTDPAHERRQEAHARFFLQPMMNGSTQSSAFLARQYLRVFALGDLGLDRRTADVFLRLRLPNDLAGAFLATLESERCRLEKTAAEMEEEGESEPSTEPAGQRQRYEPRAEFATRCRRVPAWVGLLCRSRRLCVHVG
jgi:hypothetical protein